MNGRTIAERKREEEKQKRLDSIYKDKAKKAESEMAGELSSVCCRQILEWIESSVQFSIPLAHSISTKRREDPWLPCLRFYILLNLPTFRKGCIVRRIHRHILLNPFHRGILQSEIHNEENNRVMNVGKSRSIFGKFEGKWYAIRHLSGYCSIRPAPAHLLLPETLPLQLECTDLDLVL